jgi:hypothetical protein
MFPPLVLPENSRKAKIFIIKFFPARLVQIEHYKQLCFSVCPFENNINSGICIR